MPAACCRGESRLTLRRHYIQPERQPFGHRVAFLVRFEAAPVLIDLARKIHRGRYRQSHGVGHRDAQLARIGLSRQYER